MKQTMLMTIGATYKLWCSYMKSVAQAVGVPDSYRLVLTYLLRHPQANQKEIAEYRNVTTASISQTVKEMRLGGYLDRETGGRDQRYVQLSLTDKGRACAEEIQRRVDRADQRILELLTPEGEQEIIGQMERLSQILREDLPGAGSGEEPEDGR